ncbi:MAG: cytochrome P450 [Myxococcota bacterium]|nr:cytochrome P450 [Myxococcota bacterium]
MEYDIQDLTLATAERDEALTWLRENDPVHWDAKNEFWLVTSHADVIEISKDPSLFSSVPKGPWHAFDGSGISIQALDGREHLAKRRIVSGLFTPRMVQRLEALAYRVIDDAIDAVVPQGGCDFVDSLAVPVPMHVIAEMVGVEDHDLERFRRWSDEMMFASDRANPAATSASQAEALASFMALFGEEIADRRREPRDDILTGLVQAADAGHLRQAPDSEKLGEDELRFFGPFLILAGNETTRHAIAHGMLALFEHPEQLARLRADPSLIATAVDEVLRWVTIVRAMRRVAMADTELGGKRIRAGDSVVMVYASANRDAAVFDDPFAFKVDRSPNEHIALGIGPHYCLGANLARMEIRVVFERVLARLPNLRLEPGTQPVATEHSVVRGVEKMPVVF